VIAGRGRDHAALTLGRVEVRDEVDPAPDLERTDRLVVLVLDPDVRADEFAQPRVRIRGRAREVRRDAAPGLEDVGERDRRAQSAARLSSLPPKAPPTIIPRIQFTSHTTMVAPTYVQKPSIEKSGAIHSASASIATLSTK